MTIAEVSKKYNLTKELLEKQREKLLQKQRNINETLERLNYKINLYDEIESGIRKDFTEKP